MPHRSTGGAAPVWLRRLRSSLIGGLLVVFLVGCVSRPAPPGGRAAQPDEPGKLPSPAVTASARVADIVNGMPLRTRIAQRFVIAVPRGFGVDGAVTREYIEMIMTDPPAGMILYPWNYTSRADVVRIIAKLQRAAAAAGSPPFLIGVDQEGGRVAAFRFDDILRLPSAAAVARHNDPVFVESVAYALGVELLGMGVNMNFAPVLDVTEREDSSIIGDRAWSGDPDTVAELGRAYLSGLTRAGVIATAKHYPGHGVTAVDSHGRLPVVDLTLEELETSHLVPFRSAVDAGVPAIMTAHLLFPRIDETYAVTVSEFFLRDHLRYDLGFTGVLISDALSMRAMSDNYPLEVTLERALRYDVDLLLLNAGFDYTAILNEVAMMVSEGRVSGEDIDRGVLRVMNLKEKYRLLSPGSREELR
jgi:beta-N-acetylhexosaminidase